MLMLARRLVAFVMLFTAWSALPAAARAPAFSLGEVTLSPHAPAHYRKLLTDTLSAELAAPQLTKRVTQNSFVVHARLAQLETQRSRPFRSQATVALVLMKAESGAIFATVQGHVVAQESAPERAEALAVTAAAKSAVKRASTALR